MDWIWIDEQHGCFDRASMYRAIQIVSLAGAAPIVRLGSNEFFRIGRALDAGAHGIIVPMVNSPEEAEAAVYAAKYPPLGGRSSGGVRLRFLGEDYAQAANDNLLVSVMVETRRAVAAAGEIAAVDGVDCIMIGPSDLAVEMGVAVGSKEHRAAIDEVLEKTTAAGKAAGMPCGGTDEALAWAEDGFTFIHAGSEFGMIRNGIALMQHALGIEGH